MEPGQNPDNSFIKKRLFCIRIEKMGEKVSDRWFKDICVTGFTDEYKDVKMMMYRDLSFDIDQRQTTMRHMFLDQQSRNGTKGPIAGRGTAMTTKASTDHDVYCFKCKERGHNKRNCPKFKPLTKPDGAAKWCSMTGPPRTATKRATAKEQHGQTRRRASLLRARAARAALRETTSPPPIRQPPPRTTNHQTARSPSSTSTAATPTSTAASCLQQQPRHGSPPAPRAQRYWSTVMRRNHSLTTNRSQG